MFDPVNHSQKFQMFSDSQFGEKQIVLRTQANRLSDFVQVQSQVQAIYESRSTCRFNHSLNESCTSAVSKYHIASILS